VVTIMTNPPPAQGKRPTCNTPPGLLAWRDRQAEEPLSVLPAEEGDQVRDRWFLQQYETKGTDTYRSPKRICDIWNAMAAEERATIASEAPAIISYEAVVKGIQQARRLRDGTVKKRKSSRPKR
jgi:hypothetical protein